MYPDKRAGRSALFVRSVHERNIDEPPQKKKWNIFERMLLGYAAASAGRGSLVLCHDLDRGRSSNAGSSCLKQGETFREPANTT